MKFFRVVLTLSVFALLPGAASPAFSQQSDPDSPASQQRPRRAEAVEPITPADDVIKVDTDLVPIDVTVTDRNGRPVRNLGRDDFRIYEDNTERPVAFFNLENHAGAKRPVAVVFALDISGSVSAQELANLRAAMKIFVDRLSDRTSLFAIVAFGMTARTIQPFTSDPKKLERSLERLEHEANGLSTHTYDAVDDSIRLLIRRAPRMRDRQLVRRAVVVVTDGFPVGDTVAASTVIERANNSDVSIYTVTLPSFSRSLGTSGRTPLPTPLDVSGLVEKTGGSNVYATDQDFSPMFRSIAEEVASTYIVAFYPPQENRRDGRFHTIRIEGPAGLILKQSRPGYKSTEK